MRRALWGGFTLVELAFVLAVVGLLIAMTVPAYQSIVRRGQAAEAALMLEHIAHAELGHRRDHGAFLACAAPLGSACWKDLGVHAEGKTHYSYRVELEGTTFRAIAEGDLDGDGEKSLFTMDGASLSLTAKDALE